MITPLPNPVEPPSNTGFVVSVRGRVVDVQFPERLPHGLHYSPRPWVHCAQGTPWLGAVYPGDRGR